MVDAAMSFRQQSETGATVAATRSMTDVDVVVSPISPSSLNAYQALGATTLVTPPQSTAWVREWAATANPDMLIATLLSTGRPVLAIALEVVKSGPFRIARFPGGHHANGNFPVADPAFLNAATSADIEALVAAIRKARPDIDLLALERLLPELDGTPNPMRVLPHFDSPNLSLAVDLTGGFETLLARSSGKRKRKKHRSQTRKFETVGSFRRIQAKTPEEVSRLLDTFYTMKRLRFEKMGIANVFAGAEVRAFFQALFTGALGQVPQPFVLHGLEVGGKLRAVTGSSRYAKRLICEFGAIIEDDLAYASPGDFLFFENIQEACRDGMLVYDYSVGDEPYKRLWCDIETRHFDVVVPLSTKGKLLALQMRLYARLKHFIKTSPLIWKLVKLVRRRGAAQPPAQPADD
jgi:CelD/BcsL family acetyltransferase involved in cellulose biosynthesis